MSTNLARRKQYGIYMENVLTRKVVVPFKLIGKNFDGKILVKNLLIGDKKNNFLRRFKNLNNEISINFDRFFVNDDDYLNDLKGNFSIKNNIVNSGFINAKLNNKNDFNLNIKTNTKKEKITNLFIENPSPFIQNFNFIKGFDNGKLSFSSIEKNNLAKFKFENL